MIHVEKLSKVFGSTPALDGISLDVAQGEVVGLLGPNGAGKTTAMRILSGAMPPTSGLVQVAGHDISRSPFEVKERIGYLPEIPPLYPEMRVAAYLRFVAELKGVPRRERRDRVGRALAECWLEDRADQPIEQLSKGYRQRVGLAQAILHDPDLLILDEPTSGLDPRQIIEVRQLIRKLSGDHTVILSSHILSEIVVSCDRVIVMNRGRVVAADSVEQLTRTFRGGESIELVVRGPRERIEPALEAVAVIREMKPLEGMAREDVWRIELRGPADADIRPRLASVVVGAGWELLEMTRSEPSLEEIFLRLTEDGGDESGNGEEPRSDTRAA